MTGRDPTTRQTLHARLAFVVIAFGIVLMGRQMYYDDEPGAIPLLLILVGAVWYFVSRRRARSAR